MKPLTAFTVANARPGKTRIERPDAGCRGLYLIIQPSGAKSWALRFRRPDGRTAKLALGTVYTNAKKEPDADPVIGGHHTLAGARRLVARLQHEIAQGRDPATAHLKERAERRDAANEAAQNTFAVAAKDFIEDYARPKVRRWKDIARLLGLDPKTETLEPIKKGIADRWASRPVGEIDGHDIHLVVDEARRVGIPGLDSRSDGPSDNRARHLFGALSTMFFWLQQKRRVQINPCGSVHRPQPPKSRDRVLTAKEIKAFWKAAESSGKPYAGLLQLLLLTGCRLNEVAGMRWSELDDNCQWVIPGERTKNHRAHVVPLPQLARDILDSTKRVDDQDLVFTTNGRSAISGWSKLKKKIDEVMKPTTPWVFHDLRRTCATGMAEIGIQPHIVEAVLNHVSGARAGVAGTYNRAAYLLEKTAALQRWAAHVESIVGDRPSAIVTDIAAAREKAAAS